MDNARWSPGSWGARSRRTGKGNCGERPQQGDPQGRSRAPVGSESHRAAARRSGHRRHHVCGGRSVRCSRVRGALRQPLPDGTIYLNRDSKDGKGFGWDEVMTLELDRLSERYARVVVGVVIQQRVAHRTFVNVLNPKLRIREGGTPSSPRTTSVTSSVLRRRRSGSSSATTPGAGTSIPVSGASRTTPRPSPGRWVGRSSPEPVADGSSADGPARDRRQHLLGDAEQRLVVGRHVVLTPDGYLEGVAAVLRARGDQQAAGDAPGPVLALPPPRLKLMAMVRSE